MNAYPQPQNLCDRFGCATHTSLFALLLKTSSHWTIDWSTDFCAKQRPTQAPDWLISIDCQKCWINGKITWDLSFVNSDGWQKSRILYLPKKSHLSSKHFSELSCKLLPVFPWPLATLQTSSNDRCSVCRQDSKLWNSRTWRPQISC